MLKRTLIQVTRTKSVRFFGIVFKAIPKPILETYKNRLLFGKLHPVGFLGLWIVIGWKCKQHKLQE